MSTAIADQPAVRASSTLVPRNDVNVLCGVTWEEYLTFRDDPANDGLRMYYSDGALLLMTVSYLHERIRTLMSLLLWDWLELHDVPVINAGQCTLRRKSHRRGLESDNCYYIRSLAQIEGKMGLDLSADPPPDLAIKVDLTTESALKFDIYAALQIPEIWVWEESRIQVYRLDGTNYQRRGQSEEIAGFPLSFATEVIRENLTQNDIAVKRAFRHQLEQQD